MNELPSKVDVAIIGGGFAGMSTAWALARAGVRDTIVLERETELGRYASGRSAGLGRQLAEDNETTQLTVRGAELMRAMPGDLDAHRRDPELRRRQQRRGVLRARDAVRRAGGPR